MTLNIAVTLDFQCNLYRYTFFCFPLPIVNIHYYLKRKFLGASVT